MDIEPAGVLYLPARDEILSAERNITPEQLQSQREKELRRTGLLLSEPEVLQAMEHEALQSPRFLPVRVNREGDVSGALASAAQLGQAGAVCGAAAPPDRPGGPGRQHRRGPLLPQ